MNVYDEVSAFYRAYRGQKCVYGRSVEGRDLYAMYIGSSEGAQGISQYAIHAREWVTALLALRHIQRGVERGGFWILPLANPDGALLSEIGAAAVSPARRKFLISVNGGEDFSLWKANANAVDLNVNFDARWGTGAENVRVPSPQGYIGRAPFSEPETRCLCAFTLRVCPNYTVSWHTKGEEIYWEFHTPRRARLRDLSLARALSASTGYPLASVKRSAGGYKDWCIERLKIPAFTVEAGADSHSHPLRRDALGELSAAALDALADLAKAF